MLGTDSAVPQLTRGAAGQLDGGLGPLGEFFVALHNGRLLTGIIYWSIAAGWYNSPEGIRIRFRGGFAVLKNTQLRNQSFAIDYYYTLPAGEKLTKRHALIEVSPIFQKDNTRK